MSRKHSFIVPPSFGYCCFLNTSCSNVHARSWQSTHAQNTHTFSHCLCLSVSLSYYPLLWKWSEQEHNAQIFLWIFLYVRSVPSEFCACQCNTSCQGSSLFLTFWGAYPFLPNLTGIFRGVRERKAD